MKSRKPHTILSISYSLDVVDCTCGWSGKAKSGQDWLAHRSETGLTVARNGARDAARKKPSQWSTLR